jgi:predicted TIM-barrel fold metal-dependent hydrolase
VLKFDGVGLYTNYQGRYIGHDFLNPILEELNHRGTTCLVHPVAPTPEVKLPNLSTPGIEYCFDTTRAVTSMLLSGARKKFPKINLIFSHGGGAVPFLAGRIVGQAGIPYQGGLNPKESAEELKGYYFDLAAAHNAPQLAALNEWVGSSRLLIGSDSQFASRSLEMLQYCCVISKIC